MERTERPTALGMHRIPIRKVIFFEVLWLLSTVSILERAGWVSVDYLNVPVNSILDFAIRNVRFLLFLLIEIVRYSWESLVHIFLFLFRYDLSWISITIYHTILFFFYIIGSSYSQEYFHLVKFLDARGEYGQASISREFQAFRDSGNGNRYFVFKGFLTAVVVFIFYWYVVVDRWDVFKYTANSSIIFIITVLCFWAVQLRKNAARIKVVNLHSGYLWAKKWTKDSHAMGANPSLFKGAVPVPMAFSDEPDQPMYHTNLPLGGFFVFSAIDDCFVKYVTHEGAQYMGVDTLSAAQAKYESDLEQLFIAATFKAKKGDPDAAALTGYCLYFGFGVDLNIPDGHRLLDLALEEKSSLASLYKAIVELNDPMQEEPTEYDIHNAAEAIRCSFFMDDPAKFFGLSDYEVEQLSPALGETRALLDGMLEEPDLTEASTASIERFLNESR